MSAYQYDLFIIGAGSGGVRAGRTAAGFGARVAVAEERYPGGTCVNVGCVPKKLFVYASRVTEDIDIAGSFGWDIDTPGFDWKKLIANKNKEIERLHGIYTRLLNNAGADLLRGRATIIDAHTVEVNGTHHTAERILVATGGWPDIPNIPGRERVISSNEVFFLKTLPKKIIIVGGGYIAVEFAGIFNGLGVETGLLYRGPLFLRGFDRELREKLAIEMRKKGIDIKFSTNITKIDKTGGDLTVTSDNGDTLHADLVMYATGRNPNTKNIGLERVGVELDDQGAIVVNKDYQTSVSSIYAIGDVTNRVNLTPVALAEGTALAENLYAGNDTIVDYSNIPTCVFSQPNLGTAGLTEEDARTQYAAIDIYKSSFRPMRLSLSDGDEKTFMKIIVAKQSDRVIGVHILGPDAGEIIQGIGIAIKAGATKKDFDATIGIHPTAAEELVSMREPAGQ